MTGLVMFVAGLLTAALCVVVLFAALLLFAAGERHDDWGRRELRRSERR